MPTYTDAEARELLREARKSFLRDLFTPTHLEFKSSAMRSILGWMTKDAVSIRRNISQIGRDPQKSALQQLSEGREKAAELSRKIFKGADVTSVIAKVGAATPAGEAISQFLDVMPGVGSVVSGVKALTEFARAIGDAWTQADLRTRQCSVRAGDVRTACVAIEKVIERSRNEHLAKGSINAIHAATTAGLFAADFGVFSGPAAGALKSAAQLSLRMYLMARDLEEMEAANDALQDAEEITADIFATSPILGCYVMTEGNAFMLLNFMVHEIGSAQWMDRIQRLRTDIEPIQNKAAVLARDSSLELKDLATDMWKYRSPGKLQQLKNWWRAKFPKKSKYGPGIANEL